MIENYVERLLSVALKNICSISRYFMFPVKRKLVRAKAWDKVRENIFAE